MEQPRSRDEVVAEALKQAHLDLVVCGLPMNVLLLTGYWPVVGRSLAVASSDGLIALIVPEDEDDLAEQSWADEVRTFKAGSLQRLQTAAEPAGTVLGQLAKDLKLAPKRLGFEHGDIFEPSPYASIYLYWSKLPGLLVQHFPLAALVSADDLLARLRSVKTAGEVERVRTACGIAAGAYGEGRAVLRAGITEAQAAAAFRVPLSTAVEPAGPAGRCDGYTFCMSGANSARAFGAYARSRGKNIDTGDFVLVHCNSYADGYWTDITRTYCIGEPDARQKAIYQAVFEAREAALAAARPGARGSELDTAARSVLDRHGFGAAFKHSTGHGLGFGAINHNAPPRLHPASDDVLEEGMVFNIEPAVYIEGYGGVRHCDVVTLNGSGCEVLTPFHGTIEDLTIASRTRTAG